MMAINYTMERTGTLKTISEKNFDRVDSLIKRRVQIQLKNGTWGVKQVDDHKMASRNCISWMCLCGMKNFVLGI
jgi:hypothetical protein